MVTDVDPIIDNWYRHLDKGQRFQVVALDEESGLIEIQHFDGDVEEIEMESWYEMDLASIDKPENPIGALDVPEMDDLANSVTDTSLEDWNAPLEEFQLVEDENGDEWGEEENTLEVPWDES